tara:strand:- start:4953 stop:6734 length:1782 start_codon:yes stop_codon:yes gene_type:complete
MKKYIFYIGILTVGLFLGSNFFGKNSNTEIEHTHTSAVETNKMWTCSMHPQIMRPEAGDCPICGMDLIPIESNSEGLLEDQFKLSHNAMALANIQTSIVGKSISDINTGIVLSGKIVENENETATIPAHFDGRIEKLYLKSLGERVVKGQAIADVYSPTLIAAQQELITAFRIKESQPQLYKAVKNKLKNWMIDDVQLKEIETTGQVKKRVTIYSHITGVVTAISINEGSHIMHGKPIFKVSNLKTVWANFDVYENQISQISKGQDIVVTTNTYPNKEFTDQVDFIDPILDTKTRTVKLRVVLNNKEGLFKPGMFVKGRINRVVLNKKELVIIPSSAVLWTGKRSVIYIKNDPIQPVFEMREITLGNKTGANYVVLDGLNNGDEIVTNGTFTVDAAAQLQGKKSMMNKDVSKVMIGHKEYHTKEENASTTNKSHIKKNKILKTSIAFKNKLQTVFNNYIQLKDAFVDEDSNSAMLESKNLLDNLTKVDMKLVTDKVSHSNWMSMEKEIRTAATSILNTSNITDQRNYFKRLSAALMDAIQVFGVNETVFVEFCPMADSNKGAYWLSKEEKVINPYFGKRMLTCGEVKQVITNN